MGHNSFLGVCSYFDVLYTGRLTVHLFEYWVEMNKYGIVTNELILSVVRDIISNFNVKSTNDLHIRM